MSLQPLTELLDRPRGSLNTIESASRDGRDGPALADLKSHLRLRIATLEVALRRAAETTAVETQRETPPPPPAKNP
jgi:hypothetical protein